MATNFRTARPNQADYEADQRAKDTRISALESALAALSAELAALKKAAKAGAGTGTTTTTVIQPAPPSVLPYYQTLQQDGVSVRQRPTENFIGFDDGGGGTYNLALLADNPTTNATDVKILPPYIEGVQEPQVYHIPDSYSNYQQWYAIDDPVNSINNLYNYIQPLWFLDTVVTGTMDFDTANPIGNGKGDGFYFQNAGLTDVVMPQAGGVPGAYRLGYDFIWLKKSFAGAITVHADATPGNVIEGGGATWNWTDGAESCVLFAYMNDADGTGTGTGWYVVATFPGVTTYTGTITTAKLTGGGANGSMVFKNGVLASQTPAT